LKKNTVYAVRLFAVDITVVTLAEEPGSGFCVCLFCLR